MKWVGRSGAHLGQLLPRGHSAWLPDGQWGLFLPNLKKCRKQEAVLNQWFSPGLSSEGTDGNTHLSVFPWKKSICTIQKLLSKGLNFSPFASSWWLRSFLTGLGTYQLLGATMNKDGSLNIHKSLWDNQEYRPSWSIRFISYTWNHLFKTGRSVCFILMHRAYKESQGKWRDRRIIPNKRTPKKMKWR